jgi:hypothetical protein
MSVATGAMTSAVTVTVDAGNYCLTEAGGVDSLIDTLETEINGSIAGAPQNASAVQAMLGYGTWTNGAGWLCQESSGSLAATFGAPSLTAGGTPTYRQAGTGADYAVGFDAVTEYFDGGNNFNVTGTDDIIVAWVAYFTSAPSAIKNCITKIAAGAGWQINFDSGSGGYYFQGFDSTPTQLFLSNGASIHAGEWHVGIATIDRSTGKARIGTRSMAGASSVLSEENVAATSMSNAVSFRVGDSAAGGGNTATEFYLADLYVVTGSSVATGLSSNISTALASFASAVASTFTVSLDTANSTGRVAISNSWWPSCVTFTSTALRDVLGFEYDFDYPQTAAQMAVAAGGGTWTGGWLCNETSGNLAPSFGSASGTVTLTAVSAPTYSNQGARGGADKSIGFDSAADAFSGGDSYDATATEDLAICWVGYLSSSSGDRDMFSKYTADPGYYIYQNNTGSNLRFTLRNGGNRWDAETSAIATKEWYVGLAVLDRDNGQAQIGTIGLRSGSSTLGSAVPVSAVSFASSASFLMGDGAGAITGNGPDTNLKIAALYVATGSQAADGLMDPTTGLSGALTSLRSYMLGQTGTQQARGLWFPDCPLSIEGDPAVAPRVTDHRTTMSPTGVVLGLTGNSFYRHRGIHWSHVPRDRVWEAATTYDNASWQTFADDCLYGLGNSLFTPASPLQIYWDDAGTVRAVGYTYDDEAGIPGWSVINVRSTEPKKSSGEWTGLWRIELGDVVSGG